jgi:amino acid efflux transporter
VFFVFHLDLQTFILIHISSMVAVYALGMVSAVKLLRVGSAGWVMAVLSVVLMAGLLVLTGWHLVVPAVLALVAIAVTVIRKLRARDRAHV